MTTIVIHLRTPPAEMPDADTDVLIFAAGDAEAQLGALIGEEDGRPVWVDAHGMHVARVDAWCELPRRRDPKTLVAAVAAPETALAMADGEGSEP